MHTDIGENTIFLTDVHMPRIVGWGWDVGWVGEAGYSNSWRGIFWTPLTMVILKWVGQTKSKHWLLQKKIDANYECIDRILNEVMKTPSLCKNWSIFVTFNYKYFFTSLSLG